MSLRIGGMGWVTPLGSGISAVWERLLNGDLPREESLSSASALPSYLAYRVAADVAATAHPRLRRSSAISRFAAAAGLAALADAGVQLDEKSAERTAIIFAVSNGGVIYTKRFYHEVVESGAQAASPLLFPETVFNAPASHLAAILGITGASYTLVGDGAVGILALKMTEDLMENPALDRCLVIGAEEADWLLCDAYRRWHLLRDRPPIETFEGTPRGTILSEGAGALLLDRTSLTTIDTIEAGGNFHRQREAAAWVDDLFGKLSATDEDLIIASANGTFIDRAEAEAVLRHCAGAQVYAPKAALGESVGASSIWQVICGAQALRTQQLPPLKQVDERAKLRVIDERQDKLGLRRAVVSVCGMNQQVAALTLSMRDGAQDSV